MGFVRAGTVPGLTSSAGRARSTAGWQTPSCTGRTRRGEAGLCSLLPPAAGPWGSHEAAQHRAGQCQGSGGLSKPQTLLCWHGAHRDAEEPTGGFRCPPKSKKSPTTRPPPILCDWGATAAGCPRAPAWPQGAPGGHLPESHQADLQGSVEVRVPLPGDRGRFGLSRQEGAHFPRWVPAGCPQAHRALPAASSTFRKALFSRAFMITGGIARAEEKEMSSVGPH